MSIRFFSRSVYKIFLSSQSNFLIWEALFIDNSIILYLIISFNIYWELIINYEFNFKKKLNFNLVFAFIKYFHVKLFIWFCYMTLHDYWYLLVATTQGTSGLISLGWNWLTIHYWHIVTWILTWSTKKILIMINWTLPIHHKNFNVKT